MNCLIILLLLFCGGCQNGCGCNGSEGCCPDHEHHHRDSRESNDDCSCKGSRGTVRNQRSSEREDRDCNQGEPAAWREGREGKRNSYPSISGGETCGCDPE